MFDRKRKQPQDIVDQATDELLAMPVPPGPPQEVLQALMAVGATDGQGASRSTFSLRMGYIMNRMAKPIAAVIVLGALGFAAYLLLGTGNRSSTAFAEVCQKIQQARNATFTLTWRGTVGSQPAGSMVAKVMLTETGRMRQEMPNGEVAIMDFTTGNSLTYDPKKKEAVTMRIEGMPRDAVQINWLEYLKKETQRPDAEEMGIKQIDGQQAKGCRFRKPGNDLTVWADPRSGNPIQVEIAMDSSAEKVNLVMTDFKLDQPMDPSLFDLTPPGGYKLSTAAIDFSNPAEKDLIELLRRYAEVSEGQFPSTIEGQEAQMTVAKDLMKKAMQRKPADKKEAETAATMAQKQMFDIIGLGGRVTIFLGQNKGYQYAGKGVKLGAARTPIFWHQPKGDTSCRVIYGDLSVREVPPDKLPATRPKNQ